METLGQKMPQESHCSGHSLTEPTEAEHPASTALRGGPHQESSSSPRAQVSACLLPTGIFKGAQLWEMQARVLTGSLRHGKLLRCVCEHCLALRPPPVSSGPCFPYSCPRLQSEQQCIKIRLNSKTPSSQPSLDA